MRLCETIEELGWQAQALLSRSVKLGMTGMAEVLQDIDVELVQLWHQVKRDEEGVATRYIWRTEGDNRVRDSHEANDGEEFSTDDAPDTGAPGEDFNCRCWAEPVDGDRYVQQYLLTEVEDNEDKWGNGDFVKHFLSDKGGIVTLQESGYLGSIIDYYANHAISKVDGMPGIYRRVRQQIIDKAFLVKEGNFIYDFNGTYDFQEVLFSFGNSTVIGLFVGDVRNEKGFMVINGYVTYDFIDEFTDPASLVELQVHLGMDRARAEQWVRNIENIFAKRYFIKDRWQTKFNATVKIIND